MNYYKYYDLGPNGERIESVVSEEEILDSYWDWWKGKMIAKYGEESELISPERCIEDWTVVYWAKVYHGS